MHWNLVVRFVFPPMVTCNEVSKYENVTDVECKTVRMHFGRGKNLIVRNKYGFEKLCLTKFRDSGGMLVQCVWFYM